MTHVIRNAPPQHFSVAKSSGAQCASNAPALHAPGLHTPSPPTPGLLRPEQLTAWKVAADNDARSVLGSLLRSDRSPEQGCRELSRSWEGRRLKARSQLTGTDGDCVAIWHRRLTRLASLSVTSRESSGREDEIDAALPDIQALIRGLQQADASLVVYADRWLQQAGHNSVRSAAMERIWLQLERLSLSPHAEGIFAMKPALRCALLPGGLHNPPALVAAYLGWLRRQNRHKAAALTAIWKPLTEGTPGRIPVPALEFSLRHEVKSRSGRMALLELQPPKAG